MLLSVTSKVVRSSGVVLLGALVCLVCWLVCVFFLLPCLSLPHLLNHTRK